jgi:hypothetical protein
VLDSFNAGGNQGALWGDNSSDNLQFNDNLTYTYKQHTFKMGVSVEATSLKNVSRSNFGGTFTFGADVERDGDGHPVPGAAGEPIVITSLEHYRRTLLGIAGYRPSQFSILRGDPFVGFSQWEVGWFAQDDWRVSPRLMFSYGLRHELQTHLVDKLNIAPRVGLAWVPDKQNRSTIRAGAGIFYSRLASGITLDTIRVDGRHQQQFIIQGPTFFPDVPETFSGAITPSPAIRIESPGLNAPYSIISTVSYERQLPWKLQGSIGYTWQRGVHLLRTRNINAPAPEASGLPPYPDRGPILQFESTGVSTRHELLLSLRANLNRKFAIFGNYTLASTRSNTDDAYTAPSSSYDLSTEIGPANFDQRHQFFLGGSFSLPWGLKASPLVFVKSGRPFNITTGLDNNGDTLFTDRPAFSSPDDIDRVVTRFGVFTPSPRLGGPIIPRNFGHGPGQVSVNLNFSKTFAFCPAAGGASGQGRDGRARPGGNTGRSGPTTDPRRRCNMTFGLEVENMFNHTNLSGYNGVLTSPTFGTANRALGARRVGLSLSFNF